MGAVRIVAPTQLAVSVAEARTRLRLEDTATDTDVLRLLAACTNQVEHITGRALVTQQWRLVAPLFNARCPTSGELDLPRPPLISVDQVQYLDRNGNLQNLPDTEYEVDDTGLIGCIRPAFGKIWPSTANHPSAVRVSFTAGYGPPESVEPDIVIAILLLAGHLDINREATTDRSLSELPMGAQSLLAPYVIPRVC